MKKFKLDLTHQAETVLESIHDRDYSLYQRLANVLDSLENDPFQGKILKGRLSGFYSYRVGSYRILYQIFKQKLLIVVIDIGHRREIYR